MKTPAANTTDIVANNKTFSRFVSSMTAKEETKKYIKSKVFTYHPAVCLVSHIL
jgi:hypothetical protein